MLGLVTRAQGNSLPLVRRKSRYEKEKGNYSNGFIPCQPEASLEIRAKGKRGLGVGFSGLGY